MKAILLGGGLALLFSLLGTRAAIPLFTQLGLRPADPRRRPDQPPHQARHADHGRRRHHRLGGARLLPGRADHRRPSRSASALLLLFLFVGLGAVGFLDDFIKISKQRSLGLRSKAKMIGQTVVALVFGWLALSHMARGRPRRDAGLATTISFIRDLDFALPTVVALALIWVMITGTSNAVNLTDGLDGLATGACVMVFGAYMLVNIWQNNQCCATAPRPGLLRGARPARPRRGRGRDHRRLLRLPVVERLAGPDLHGRHRLARRSAARWPASRS